MTRMSTPRVVVPASVDDPAEVNRAIIAAAAGVRQADESIIVHVDYVDRGDDLVVVSADGLIEAVNDGPPTI